MKCHRNDSKKESPQRQLLCNVFHRRPLRLTRPEEEHEDVEGSGCPDESGDEEEKTDGDHLKRATCLKEAPANVRSSSDKCQSSYCSKEW